MTSSAGKNHSTWGRPRVQVNTGDVLSAVTQSAQEQNHPFSGYVAQRRHSARTKTRHHLWFSDIYVALRGLVGFLYLIHAPTSGITRAPVHNLVE